MNAKGFKFYNEEDIEIHEEGISVKDIFLNKKELADTFNEYVVMNNFIEKQCANE